MRQAAAERRISVGMFARGYRLAWRILGERVYYAKSVVKASQAIRRDHPGIMSIVIHFLNPDGGTNGSDQNRY